MIKKKFIYFIFIILFIAIGLLVGKKIIKNFASNEQKELIKKYIFSFKYISAQDEKIKSLQGTIPRYELDFKNSKKNIQVGKAKDFELSNDKILEKFILADGFYSGIYNYLPGSGFIDFHKDNLFVASSRGILAYSKDIKGELILKQIENNINEFIGIEQFNKSNKFSLNDLLIHQNIIYISYHEEKEEDCWTNSIIFSEVNYEFINFKKLFSNKECINSKNNVDSEFNAHQSGGRIVHYDNNNILFSIGDYRERHYAQDEKSIFGKIIKININNSDYKIISMGHRNPQGLFFDQQNNFVIETEHGPLGGDEINLIEINSSNSGEIPNYGWAIASAGEHYGGKTPANETKYKKYPLYKSHSENGFIEPLFSFVPSIGISEIVKVGENKFIVSSLKDKSIYSFQLSENQKLINLKRIEIFERIRDLKYKDGKLYLFLEDTPSIGIINFEN